jgi:hypothetical protein
MATKERISLNVNNKSYDLEVDPNMPLLYALRNDLDVTGPKFGYPSSVADWPSVGPVRLSWMAEQCGLV